MNLRTIGVTMLTLSLAACSLQAAEPKALPRPATDLEAKGAESKTAVFAAGCFWCVEGAFEVIPGVTDVVSGYAGGTADDAVYRKVASGLTDHAEAVLVTYDPKRVTYGQLLQVLFATHDSTTLNRQGPDHGTQYRSSIFFADAEEKRVAEAYIAQLTAAKTFSRPIVTKLEPLEKFYPAEAYHQDFVRRNPNHPYVRAWALAKVDKAKKLAEKLSGKPKS